jgi:hypothetical protein
MFRDLITNPFRKRKDATATTRASKKQKTLDTINESDTSSTKPRTRRTVGLTEARLRARNKQSWMTSTKGWSDLFGRFTAASKR